MMPMPNRLKHITSGSLLRRIGHQFFFFFITSAFLVLSSMVGCSPLAEDLAAVNYTPLPGDDWKVKTPAEQGIDPMLVAELYFDAAELSNLYGLLVIKNGYLIAEDYFNDGAVDRKTGLASATKCYTSALVGIALDQGYLDDVDEKMIDFFPEYADQITDPRKKQISIEDMLKMRSGYPWEERVPPYMDMILTSDDWLPFIVDFPLSSDPGVEYNYSNLTAHLLGVIVARASETDLKSFGQEHLFSPINAEVGDWWQDANNYHLGSGLISFTARDAAKFGLLYLNNGIYEGTQVVSAAWVEKSLQRYSEDINYTGWIVSKLGRYFRDLGVGYQWYSARVGAHHFNFAWGHGGNLIVLLRELDMVIVTTANPSLEIWGQESWKHEGAIIDLVGKFISSLS
jgi:CubicO group peptidase (beta-lactamase class C family)